MEKAVLEMKPSAYRSMRLKKAGLNKGKPTREKTQDLIRWKNEKWQNLTAKLTDDKFYLCGTKGKRQKSLNLLTVCRPSVKVNEKTPTPLAGVYSFEKIKKAIQIKSTGSTIRWKNL